MWWRFYSGLSVQVIDHLLNCISPGKTALLIEPKNCSPELEKMLHEINTQMVAISEQQKAALKAEIASHARTMALSEISHDLRTPLNAIIGFTQMMESGIFGPIGNQQYNEYLRHIRDSGYDLLERIEELLDTAPKSTEPPPERSATAPLREFAA